MRFYESKLGYFYKEYKNGKKKRITREEFIKNTNQIKKNLVIQKHMREYRMKGGEGELNNFLKLNNFNERWTTKSNYVVGDRIWYKRSRQESMMVGTIVKIRDSGSNGMRIYVVNTISLSNGKQMRHEWNVYEKQGESNKKTSMLRERKEIFSDIDLNEQELISVINEFGINEFGINKFGISDVNSKKEAIKVLTSLKRNDSNVKFNTFAPTTVEPEPVPLDTYLNKQELSSVIKEFDTRGVNSKKKAIKDLTFLKQKYKGSNVKFNKLFNCYKKIEHKSQLEMSSNNIIAKISDTLAPTTLAPTTLAPTTLAPTTLAPTTLAPTTLAPTTVEPLPEAIPDFEICLIPTSKISQYIDNRKPNEYLFGSRVTLSNRNGNSRKSNCSFNCYFAPKLIEGDVENTIILDITTRNLKYNYLLLWEMILITGKEAFSKYKFQIKDPSEIDTQKSNGTPKLIDEYKLSETYFLGKEFGGLSKDEFFQHFSNKKYVLINLYGETVLIYRLQLDNNYLFINTHDVDGFKLIRNLQIFLKELMFDKVKEQMVSLTHGQLMGVIGINFSKAQMSWNI
jgi:hypothetical protein